MPVLGLPEKMQVELHVGDKLTLPKTKMVQLKEFSHGILFTGRVSSSESEGVTSCKKQVKMMTIMSGSFKVPKCKTLTTASLSEQNSKYIEAHLLPLKVTTAAMGIDRGC